MVHNLRNTSNQNKNNNIHITNLETKNPNYIIEHKQFDQLSYKNTNIQLDLKTLTIKSNNKEQELRK